MKSIKYGVSPEEIERRSLAGKQFGRIFNMHRIEKTSEDLIDMIKKTIFCQEKETKRGTFDW